MVGPNTSPTGWSTDTPRPAGSGWISLQASFRVIRALEADERDQAEVDEAVGLLGSQYGYEALVFLTDACWHLEENGSIKSGLPMLSTLSQLAVEGEIDMLARGEGDTDRPWRGDTTQ